MAHAQPHGLARFVMASSQADGEGPRGVTLNSGARDLALETLAGPLCAATLVEHLSWYPGWDYDDVSPLVTRMLHAWGRIAGVPYTGPETLPPAAA
jgi:hypothetical protein